MTEDRSELLEICPFCGSYPWYVVDRVEGIFLTCPKCKIRTPGFFDDRSSDFPKAVTEVRKLWNTRYIG